MRKSTRRENFILCVIWFNQKWRVFEILIKMTYVRIFSSITSNKLSIVVIYRTPEATWKRNLPTLDPTWYLSDPAVLFQYLLIQGGSKVMTLVLLISLSGGNTITKKYVFSEHSEHFRMNYNIPTASNISLTENMKRFRANNNPEIIIYSWHGPCCVFAYLREKA